MNFSIIICTYNGEKRLPDTLMHLGALEIPNGMKVELLVIDNASIDNTELIVINGWKELKNPFPLKIYQMKEPGKSNALRLGVEKGTGEYFIICDDDNWLNPDYLIEALQLMENHPNVGIAGGLVTAIADFAFPDWFKEYHWAFACGSQFDKPGVTTGMRPLWGAGMLIRGRVAKGIFSETIPLLLSCRKGSQLLSGGDDEICYRAWLLGMDSFYTPKLKLKHFMPQSRLTINYREALITGFKHQVNVIGSYRIFYTVLHYHRSKSFLKVKKIIAYIIYRVLGRTRQAAHASDYLFFLTRKSRWQTPENYMIYKFYNDVAMNFISKN